MGHSIAHPSVSISYVVYLLLFLSYLAGSKSVSVYLSIYLSDPDTMTVALWKLMLRQAAKIQLNSAVICLTVMSMIRRASIFDVQLVHPLSIVDKFVELNSLLLSRN